MPNVRSFLLLVLLSFASAANERHEETELLASVFTKSCNFSGSYQQKKQLKNLPMPLISSGDFFFSCDLGLAWRTRSPIEETIIFVNAANSFSISSNGDITPLSGIALYSLSNVFFRLLNSDFDYFSNEFAISIGPDSNKITLVPESKLMQKGINHIAVQKALNTEGQVKVEVQIVDVNEQATQLTLNDLTEYDIKGRKAAFKQCEQVLNDKSLCQLLRSPKTALRQ